MSKVIDPTVTKDALDAFRRIATMIVCRFCLAPFMQTDISPSVCPHCLELQ